MAEKLTHRQDVLKIVEDKQIKFIRLWFTDVLGTLKSFAITPAELEGAFDEGMGFDGSSIDGFARIQESDMVAYPDPSHLHPAPLARRRRRHRPHVLRHQAAQRRALRTATRATCCAKSWPRPRPWATPCTWVRNSSSSTSRTATAPRPSTAVATSTSPPSTPVATCAATPSTPCRRWASRWSTPTTKWPRRSTRSTCATKTC